MRTMFSLAIVVSLTWITAPCTYAGPEASKPEAKQADAKKADESPSDKADAKKADTTKAEATKAADKKAEPAVKKVSIVRFTLKGTLPEGPSSPGLFGDLQTSLSTLVERLDQAAEDKNVAAIWLRIESLSIGRGKLNEVRAAIARVRKAGKLIVAELTSAEPAQYLIASACDKVFLVPNGVILLPGVRAEVTFYKGLLDKVGVEFDMMQMGKYKGAAEPMTRNGMSDAMRENFTAIVDDLYGDLADTIAADRGMKDYQAKVLIDEGLFTATAARRAKLVDEIAYADQLQESLRKQLKADELQVVTNYKKKQLDTDFSGIGGFMKLMELMMGGKPSEAASKNKRVAVVYAVGPIMEGKSDSDIFGDSTVGSTTLVAALKKAGDDPKVVAIVLRIDSPGGSAIASDLIWRETVRIEKPIIASMGDIAGSGGYYIAMGADRIIAEPGTITGSIGVVGGKVVLKGLYDKVGVSTEVISRGEKSGVFASTGKFSDAERKAMNAFMHEVYGQFVTKAAQGRKMPRQQLESLAQGRIYTGRQAVENGLIDKVGTLRDAVAEAKKAAGLKADEEVDLQILPQPRSFFEQLLGGDDLSGEMGAALPDLGLRDLGLSDLGLSDLGLPELVALGRQLKRLRAMFVEPALVWMPYDVRIK